MTNLSSTSNFTDHYQNVMLLHNTLEEKHEKNRTVCKNSDDITEYINRGIDRMLKTILGYFTAGLASPLIGFTNTLALSSLGTICLEASFEQEAREKKFAGQIRSLKSDAQSSARNNAIKNDPNVIKFESSDGIRVFSNFNELSIAKEANKFFIDGIEKISIPDLSIVSVVTDTDFYSKIVKESLIGQAVLVSFGALVSKCGVYLFS